MNVNLILQMLRYVTILILFSALGNIAFANRANEYYQHGIKYLEEGRYQKALKAFDESIRARQADAEVNWLAKVHYQKASVYYA